jgi:hypothetical protein
MKKTTKKVKTLKKNPTMDIHIYIHSTPSQPWITTNQPYTASQPFNPCQAPYFLATGGTLNK